MIISSFERQKGVNVVQRCSIENQKGDPSNNILKMASIPGGPKRTEQSIFRTLL